MILKGEIIEIYEDSYQGKRGQVKTHVLTVLDRTDGPRMKNTIDFRLSEEQASKFPVHENGKLQGKPIELGITDIQPGFGGRMRSSGTILQFKL